MLTNFISTASVYFILLWNVVIFFYELNHPEECAPRRRLIGAPMRNPTELRCYGLRPSPQPLRNRNRSIAINNSILT